MKYREELYGDKCSFSYSLFYKVQLHPLVPLLVVFKPKFALNLRFKFLHLSGPFMVKYVYHVLVHSFYVTAMPKSSKLFLWITYAGSDKTLGVTELLNATIHHQTTEYHLISISNLKIQPPIFWKGNNFTMDYIQRLINLFHWGYRWRILL